MEQEFGLRIYVLTDGRLRSDEYEFEIESRKESENRAHAPAPRATPSAPTKVVSKSNRNGDNPKAAKGDDAPPIEEDPRPVE